jgi:hypothetical protein
VRACKNCFRDGLKKSNENCLQYIECNSLSGLF